MKLLDQTFPTPEQNLACDEALLDCAESGEGGETLRFWQPTLPFVVLGHSNRLALEADASACERLRIPMLRRCSGGGTVLQGPGCLNYALILRIEAAATRATVTQTNRYIMGRHRDGLSALLREPVEVEGVTDLVIAGRKFSGNAQRRKRHFLLFHGTFLLDLDVALVERVLPLPSKQPGYRGNRGHLDFLRNLHVSAAAVKEVLRASWQANLPLPSAPIQRIERLVQAKYSLPAWTRKF
jgi:lipoate-protein ligase A